MLKVAHHTEETSSIFTPAVCAFTPPSPGEMARQARMAVRGACAPFLALELLLIPHRPPRLSSFLDG